MLSVNSSAWSLRGGLNTISFFLSASILFLNFTLSSILNDLFVGAAFATSTSFETFKAFTVFASVSRFLSSILSTTRVAV